MDRNRSRSQCKSSAGDVPQSTSARLLYSVRKWDDLFENSQSRKCGRLSWIPVPNKHDGKSYRRLIACKNGPALYAAWMLILQVASKCPIRGVLGDDDGPLDADDLSHKTGCPAELFAVALKMLSEPRIGWLEVQQVGAEWEPTPSPLPDQSTDAGQNRTEVNGTEPTRQESKTVPGRVSATEPNLKATTKPFDWLPKWPELRDFASIAIEPIPRSEIADHVKGKRAFEPLKEEHLADPEALRNWHRWQLTLATPILGPTEAHVLLMLATAEHVRLTPKSQIKKNRVAMFAHIVSKQLWSEVRERLALVKP